MYRAHARHLITIAFVLYVVAALIQGTLQGAAAAGRYSAR
jgi:hypothetical protein